MDTRDSNMFSGNMGESPGYPVGGNPCFYDIDRV